MNALIESNPKIMLGKPVVTGTRITVEFILQELAAGKTMQALLDSHPRLTLPAIRAAFSYSAASPCQLKVVWHRRLKSCTSQASD